MPQIIILNQSVTLAVIAKKKPGCPRTITEGEYVPEAPLPENASAVEWSKYKNRVRKAKSRHEKKTSDRKEMYVFVVVLYL